MPVQLLFVRLAAISVLTIRQIIAFPFSLRQKRLANERAPLNADNFINAIRELDGDCDGAKLVYEKLKDWIYVTEFTPYPEDDLEKIYGIAEEELDEDLILSILNQTNIRPPSYDIVDKFGVIRTPLDVARFVKFCR
jgi:hypothetical protein